MLRLPTTLALISAASLLLTGCSVNTSEKPTSETTGQASDGQACQMWIQSYKDFVFAYTSAEKTAEEFKRDPSKFSYVDETGATVSGDFDPYEQAKVSYLALSTTLKDDTEPLVKEQELSSAFEEFFNEYSNSFENFSMEEQSSSNLENACKNLGVDTFEVQKAKREAR